MSEKTKIGWTWRQLPDGRWMEGKTFNPWIGCLKIDTACKNCYAEGFAQRWGWDVWGPSENTPRRITSEANWKQPLKWNKEAQSIGHRYSVFCASLADVFEDHPDIVDARQRLWALIEQTPWLNWLLLTKRPENMPKMAPMAWQHQWPDNVWAGTSAGTQETANKNVIHLLNVPAVVRFVSCEPMLEYVNFTPFLSGLQWIICGGESGIHARPFNLDWAEDLRNQCLYGEVPFFFKQIGGRYHDSGGRLLNGRTYDEMPLEVPVQAVKQ